MNNTAIILSTNPSYGKGYTSIPIKNVKIREIIAEVLENKEAKIHLYHKNEEKLFKSLFKKIPVVVAGGGKVYNEKNEILFIHRNGKWDLPKGKTEPKEAIELSAIREVEEETGVKELEITKFLCKTFHFFKRNGEFRLKVTYWFEMKTTYQGVLVPQLEEDIKKVKWKSYKKTKKALTNSYANIQLLFSHDYLT